MCKVERLRIQLREYGCGRVNRMRVEVGNMEIIYLSSPRFSLRNKTEGRGERKERIEKITFIILLKKSTLVIKHNKILHKITLETNFSP